MLDDDPLAEELERQLRRHLDEPFIALQESPHEAPVVVREIARQAALDALEDRPFLRVGTDQDERVVGDTDERRRQYGEQRLVVVAILEQPQVGEQIDDLLLAEVAATGHAIRRQVDGAQLLLEPLGVGAGGEENTISPGVAAPRSTSSRTRRAT